MYSEIVNDHFFHPRNSGKLEDPNVVGVAGTPERGPFMVLYLKLAGERIATATYQTYGCGPAIAAGSVLTEKIKGQTREDASVWTESRINESLGGLPQSKRHCSALAASALVAALGRWAEASGADVCAPGSGDVHGTEGVE